jgi:hypothetical protein
MQILRTQRPMSPAQNLAFDSDPLIQIVSSESSFYGRRTHYLACIVRPKDTFPVLGLLDGVGGISLFNALLSVVFLPFL